MTPGEAKKLKEKEAEEAIERITREVIRDESTRRPINLRGVVRGTVLA